MWDKKTPAEASGTLTREIEVTYYYVTLVTHHCVEGHDCSDSNNQTYQVYPDEYNKTVNTTTGAYQTTYHNGAPHANQPKYEKLVEEAF